MSSARARAKSLEAAGRFFEAAQAYTEGREPALALENLVRLGPAFPRYRDACRQAVRLAEATNRPSLALENLLADFVRKGPEDEADADVFERLSRLYERAGYPENSGEVLRKLAAYRPLGPEASARLARVAPQAAPLPDLPDLPGLPELPPSAPHDTSTLGRDSDEWRGDEGAPIRAGATIAGRYHLEERIGSGGSSVVFRATDLELGDLIAVKVLTQGVYDRETDARLRRELTLSRRVQHKNVVRLFEIGLAHGFRFISMELLTGQDLRSRIRGRPLPLAEGLDYLIQACEGLGAAHELGIVHRDVKPENCFISRGGTVKVMDFGLAKLQNAAGVTTTGLIAGTPAYMAPEQVTDFRRVGPAADIYSLGVVAYEVHTGRLPFDHPEAIPLLMMHTNDPPPPPRRRNPELPLELERLILACLRKQPADRLASCAELAGRLRAIRDTLPAARV